MTTIEMTKLLHEKSGLPLVECKEAAEASDGNLNKAKALLLANLAERSKGTTWSPGWLAIKE